MTAVGTDLAGFLLARIAEDERYATHAAGMMMGFEAGTDGIAHINRWRPARVLAECETKRRLIELGDKDSYWVDVLELLALPYADHPDYVEEWKP